MRAVSQPRVFLLGAAGQVGAELAAALRPMAEVITSDRSTLDVSDLNAVRDAMRATRATVIANAAAYTAVDRAESERDLAYRVNAELPKLLATEAARLGALLLHFSTDYVFSGAATRPYVETDATEPLNTYGRSKRDGDDAILASGAEAYVFRISWVYGRRGRNFLNTMERLAREKPELRVVADQYGAPTWSRAVADNVAAALSHWLECRARDVAPPRRGVYHMAAPDYTTWHGFASAIVNLMPAHGDWRRPPVIPIATHEYPVPATRPRWSVLDSALLRSTFGLSLPPWQEQLRRCLAAPA